MITEQSAIRNKTYIAEGHTVLNLTDEESMIDFTSTLFFRASVTVIPTYGTEAPKVRLTENTLLSLTADTAAMAYIRAYENGMPIRILQNGRPEEPLTSAIREQLEDILSLRYDAAVVSFAVEKHWIPAEDLQKLDELLHMKELRDPRKAAEALIQAMQTKMQPQNEPPAVAGPQQTQAVLPSWVCTCGSINNSKFCPECGRSSGRWRCTCGNLNTTPFCPECGSPAKNGIHV